MEPAKPGAASGCAILWTGSGAVTDIAPGIVAYYGKHTLTAFREAGLNRPLVIGAGSLAAVLVVALAVNRVRESGGLPPSEAPSVVGQAQTAPAAPTVGSPGAGTQSLAKTTPNQQDAAGQSAAGTPLPSFDVVRVNPQGQTVIAGRAAPNAEVTVLDGDQVIGKATADARGEFVVVPEKTLQPGNRSLSLIEKVPGKDEAVRSSADVLVAVPEPKRDLAG
jgi:hypothetical protein